MGGKGAAPQNNEMVEFEKQQAEEARQKEELRKQRLTTGRRYIDEMFGGTPVMEAKQAKLDLTGLTPVGLDQAVDVSGKDITRGGGKFAMGDTGWTYNPMTGDGTSGYSIYDPTGALAGLGGSWDEASQGLAGKEYTKMGPSGDYVPGTEPFGKSFYDTYENAYTAFGNRQADQQYNDAERERQFGLARAGLSASTAATDTAGKLNATLFNAKSDIASKGEAARNAKMADIVGQSDKAKAQLIQTEDPEQARIQALGMVNQQKLSEAPQVMLGDLFKPLVIGAGNAYGSYQDQNYFNQGARGRSARGDGSIVTTPTS